MKKYLLISIALAAAFLMSAKQVNADYGCGQYGQYGGCPPTQTITVNKLVGKPVANGVEYVENLTPSDYLFKGGNTIYFQVKVKNMTNQAVSNVKVVDTLPSYLIPDNGPGTYDANSRTITFTIDQLNPDEEKVYTFQMHLVSQDQFVAQCQYNQVVGYVNGVSTADTQDSSEFCVTSERTVVNVTQVPSTGPEDGLLIFGGSILSLGAGLFLKKKSA